jgi:DNA polymerase III gamma/tau subunit
MTPLFEQYRPKCWSEVVGQDKALAKIQQLGKRGLAGRAYWLSGSSGTGKSTIARLLAAEVANEHFVQELDAANLTPAALREIENEMAQYGWGEKPGRAYILNEAHGLRRDTIRQLLVLLERLPSHVVFIFTTTSEAQDGLFGDNEDAHPLLSRCCVIALARRDLAKPFAELVRGIAVKEGLDGRELAWYVKLAQHRRNNVRAMLQDVESGAALIGGVE